MGRGCILWLNTILSALGWSCLDSQPTEAELETETSRRRWSRFLRSHAMWVNSGKMSLLSTLLHSIQPSEGGGAANREMRQRLTWKGNIAKERIAKKNVYPQNDSMSSTDYMWNISNSEARIRLLNYCVKACCKSISETHYLYIL